MIEHSQAPEARRALLTRVWLHALLRLMHRRPCSSSKGPRWLLDCFKSPLPALAFVVVLALAFAFVLAMPPSGLPASRALPSKESGLFKEVLHYYEDRQLKKGLKTADTILKKFPNHGGTSHTPNNSLLR